MLEKCPECELQVSSKALVCPHCGYPLKEVNSHDYQVSKKRKRRLPNGFGQITKIKGRNLKKPYRAMVTVGIDKDGKYITKLLKPESYFLTYNDAYAALVEYNKNPYELSSDITIQELYTKWSTEYFKSLSSNSSIRTITSAWNYCSSVKKMRVRDIRARHIKECIENGVVEYKGEITHPSPGMKSRIKSLFNLMLDYAVEYELTDRNYARTFKISQDIFEESEKAKCSHISFSDKEMSVLWDNLYKIKYVDLIIIQCYTGFRPQELGLIEIKNVNLTEKYIIGGMKTDAGTNRIVPIHSKIFNLIKTKYEEAITIGSKFLLNCTDSKTHKDNSYKLTYDKYRLRFISVIKELKLNPEHKAHDPRKHFVTMAKKYNVDEYAIKYIVGHSITDITEKVYTDRNIKWLTEEIEKIK